MAGSATPPQSGPARYRRPLRIAGLVVVLLVILLAAGCLALTQSPRPGAWMLRHLFDRGAAQASAQLARHVPAGIDSLLDQTYLGGPRPLRLDVYRPAAARTAPSYAREIGLSTRLKPEQLRGLILFCGLYELTQFKLSGPVGHAMRTVLWSFSDQRDIENAPALAQASVLRHLSPRFPPTFISTGNSDPLLPQARALAAELQRLGVPTQTLFFADDSPSKQGHEYQFDLDETSARQALEQAVQFAQRRTRSD